MSEKITVLRNTLSGNLEEGYRHVGGTAVSVLFRVEEPEDEVAGSSRMLVILRERLWRHILE
jgi:hypothetical protein